MQIFKKITSMIICALMIFSLVSCTKNGDAENTSKKLSIICTIFPEYDWVKNILGDKIDEVDLKLLLDSGIDLHNYQPTVEDLASISKCDMFVYVGGESDTWVENALKAATNEKMIVVNLIEKLGDNIKEEEVIEGMEAEEEEEECEEVEYDDHVWLSVKNASIFCKALCEKIQEIDPDNKETYASNTDRYIQSLDELDEQYFNVCENAKIKTVLFGDRFPFRYMVDDYGLDYYAAFVGCSAETEASFETISFLASKVDELGLTTVLTIEGTDHRIAETIISNTKDKNQKIASLNSMQGITKKDVENDVTYISIMTDNLNTLKDALS